MLVPRSDVIGRCMVVNHVTLLFCCCWWRCWCCVQVVVVFLLSIASLIIYFIDSSTSVDLLWTPAQRKRASLPMFIYLFFYGRLILRPWLTEVCESFTRGGPWVSLEKLLLGFFVVILKLQGGPESDEIWRIFIPHPQTFCSHARTR